MTIDGTTQPGGWVELTGANAGANATGIALGADASVVRGLVVNLWDENGILVTGQGSVIAGNRIGTDVSGLAARPNLDGVNVQGPNATIGGTQGTSPVTCSGDCNLVSGNRGDGIELDTGNPAGALVVGNTIGADLIGEQPLGNNNGVIGGGMTVGGTVTAAGLAPGNLIAGNGRWRSGPGVQAR